jgi:hypothetical protein
MAKVCEVSTVNVVLNEDEAKLVVALLNHVGLGDEGWKEVASELAISLDGIFCECDLPEVSFTFEDRMGNEIEMGGIFTTIEVNEGEE